jgi:TonB family protein
LKPPKDTGAGSGQAGGGSSGRSGGGGDASQFGWYHELIHDRFYSQWDQPTSIFDSSKSFVCTLQIRIESDGKISDVKVLKSSGNVVMDDSVMAAAHRVTQIDPPPARLSSGGAYTVNINFELQ